MPTKKKTLSLGDRVRALREAGGLTQSVVAARAGYQREDLSRLETGSRAQNPTLRRVLALAAALGVSASELLEGVGPRGR